MIVIASSGLGNTRRGMEAHARDLFLNLENETDCKIKLLKGGGKTTGNEVKINNLPSSEAFNRLLSQITGKMPLQLQSLTFAIGLLPFLFKNKPSVIYLGEPFLYHYLVKIRKFFKQKFNIIFYTGGQTVPSGFEPGDTIQYVTPYIKGKRIEAKTEKQHYLIPHFIPVKYLNTIISAEKRKELRGKYNIPEKSKVILSVGSVDDSVKRMKYLIRECSGLGGDFFVLMVGEKSNETADIIEFAKNKLSDRHLITSVSRDEIADFYQLADIFVLCSLKEGFGLVYLEALSFGLPVIAHDFDVARYVMEDYGFYVDLEKTGSLPEKIEEMMALPDDLQNKQERVRFVYEKYSWETLKDSYLKMFREAACKNNRQALDLDL